MKGIRMTRIFLTMTVLAILATAPGNALPAEDKAKADDRARAIAASKAAAIDQLKEAGIADPGNDPWKLNALAYKALYEENNTKKALGLFSMNATLFWDQKSVAADVYDSLAEGHLIAGNRDQAIGFYNAAHSINPVPPSDPQLASKLERLKADPKNLPILQKEMRDVYRTQSQPIGK